MASKFKIENLEIEGFRGINASIELKDFNVALNFIFGDNGAGKSSVLGAIEWCLFGELAHQKFTETKTQDELLNALSAKNKARVKCTLTDGKIEFILHREKIAGKRGSSFWISNNKGEKFEGKEAEQKVETTFGLNFEDFYRAVYLHQESIRGLILDDPANRDEAMDRLFGLEKLRTISDSIPLSIIRNKINKIDSDRVGLSKKISGATSQIEKDLREIEENAKENGLELNDLNFESAKDYFKNIKSELDIIRKENRVVVPEIKIPNEIDDLSQGLRKIREFISKSRKELASTSLITELITKRENLLQIQKKLKKANEESDTAEKEITALEKQFGTIFEIDKKISKANEALEKMVQERSELDDYSKLISDAINYIKITSINNCPVCEQKINREAVLSSLSNKTDKGILQELNSIESEIKKEKESIESYNKAKGAIEELSKNMNDYRKDTEDLIIALTRLVSEKLPEIKELETFINKILEQLNENIELTHKANERRESNFQRMEERIGKINLIHDYLDKKNKYTTLNETYSKETTEIATLEKVSDKLNVLSDKLKQINEIIVETQITSAKSILKSSTPEIQNFYSKLTNHPIYDNIFIDVIQRNVNGSIKNSYLIKAFNSKSSKATQVNTRLSTAQMNCAALAIYLALSKALQHKLNFLILDDPSQNLDENHENALIKIIKELSQSTQILLATQDHTFQDLLKSSTKSAERKLIQLEFKAQGTVLKE